MKNISDSVAKVLGTQGIIQEEDIDTCRYGLDVLISSSLEVISILLLSAVIGNLFETFFFFVAFIPLRIYAGGYHANTKVKCYFISLVVYGLFAGLISVLPQNLYLYVSIVSTLFSWISVYLFAPVIHQNKKVNHAEIRYYRKVSITICSIQTLAIIILACALKNNSAIFALALALGQLAETSSMIVAVLQKKIHQNNTEGGVPCEKI